MLRLGELGEVPVEPTKIPCLAKGISAGLWNLLGLLLVVDSLPLVVSVSGVLLAVTVGS